MHLVINQIPTKTSMENNYIICVNRKQWMGILTIGKVYKILQTYDDNGIEFMIMDLNIFIQKVCLKQDKNLDKKN